MMAEDLSVFFDTDEHATEVQIDGETVAGIFDRSYAEVAGMGTTEPTFTMALSSMPTVCADMVLVNGDDIYTVRNVEPDGTGVVLLRLEARGP